jgi:hypothetical protein
VNLAGAFLTNMTDVDHAAWDELLRKYVKLTAAGVTGFAYGDVTAADKQSLKAYIARLQHTRASALDDADRLAFWINLYNALTVDLVLDHYPLKSIRNIAKGEPWSQRLVEVEGQALSLDEIENGILRKLWRDPRVHYAVNCASGSCPNLRPRAFTGDTIEAMLDDGARDYINHDRAVRVAGGDAELSQIFSWYARDFGGSQASLIAHLQQYASPELKERLSNVEHISGYSYDWSLNDATSARSAENQE